MSDTTIHLDNAWTIRDTLTRTNATTGAEEPATGLALTGWLAATEGGAAIHAALSVALTERGTSGTYAGTIDETALATHLGPLLAADTTGAFAVFEVVRSGDGDYRTHKRRVVRANRPAP